MLGTADDLQNWISVLRQDLYFKNPQSFKDFSKSTIGQSGRFEETATASFGGNGIYNGLYYYLVDSDISLIMLSNTGEYPAEEYLGELLGFMKEYRDSTKQD